MSLHDRHSFRRPALGRRLATTIAALLAALPLAATAELDLRLERLDNGRVRLSGQGELPDVPNGDRPADRRTLRLIGATSAAGGGATASPGFALGGKPLAQARVDAFGNTAELVFSADLDEPGDAPSGTTTITLLGQSWARQGTSGDVVWGSGSDSVMVGSYTLIRQTDSPPVADAGGPYQGKAGKLVRFDGTGSSDPDGVVTSYHWTFGDGSIGTGATPTHRYAVADDYPVTLKVTDNAGNESIADFSTVTVVGGPTRPDVILRNVNTGRWFLYRLFGTVQVDSSKMPFKQSQDFQTVARGDFDGNGYRDLLLRDVTGNRGERFYVYTLEDIEILDEGDPGLPRNLSYSLVGADDFDGDGLEDVLLRRDTGVWLLAFMNGAERRRSVVPALPTEADVAPAALGDFDGDGRADVLLAHANGDWSAYLMKGGQIKDSGAPALRDGTRYSLEAVADFDGDGDDDVLMRRISNGSWRLLLMDGVAVAQDAPVALKKMPDFRLVATIDLNGDGRHDVLLRNRVNGKWLAYHLDGPTILDQGNPGLPAALRWEFVTAQDADFDGDGDIVLRAADTGEWKVWIYADQLAAEDRGPLDLKKNLNWVPIDD